MAADCATIASRSGDTTNDRSRAIRAATSGEEAEPPRMMSLPAANVGLADLAPPKRAKGHPKRTFIWPKSERDTPADNPEIANPELETGAQPIMAREAEQPQAKVPFVEIISRPEIAPPRQGSPAQLVLKPACWRLQSRQKNPASRECRVQVRTKPNLPLKKRLTAARR